MTTTITVRKDGPYRIEGDFVLLDHEGNTIPTTPGKPVSLCRCGGSTRKPICDGTHSKIGFRGAQEAVQQSEGGGDKP